MRMRLIRAGLIGCTIIGLGVLTPGPASAQESGEDKAKKTPEKKPEFPPFKKVSKDYSKVVSTADGSQSMWTIYTREKDGQMLAELPRNFESQRYFMGMTVISGDMWAGYQASDMYVYWKRFDKRLALMRPNVFTRSTGDQESKTAVSRHFTDYVILDVPIVTMGPGGGPVVDMDDLLVGHGEKFFGYLARGLNKHLTVISEAKAFPQNVELSFEGPVASGQMRTFHYSISIIPENTGYTPREADERVGYFTTTYRDLGKYNNEDKWTRYINRWKLEKAAPNLSMSPPKEPIIFYVDHATPIRYRRWVKEGAEYWNRAFENIGIKDAVEVYYQDATTGAHMDKDPADVRYNFIMWLSNDIATAIGPSRVHPLTGQILDADIVLTDGWMRVFEAWYSKLLPEVAMEGFGPETLAWLANNPDWDPRVRMAPPSERDAIVLRRAREARQARAGHPAATADSSIIGDEEFDGLANRVSQVNGMCLAMQGKAMDLALVRMSMDALDLLQMMDDGEDDGGDGEGEGEESDKPKEDLLDGIPESFIGPLLADIVAHEVGHTLGLRHNFVASSTYSLAEINSEEFKGEKPLASSVMDYLPVNINMDDGEVQGDWAMITVGPYDMWAIEYGYTFDDPKKVLERVAEPEHNYLTDEDTWGPDPLARRYDFGADPHNFARSRMRLVEELRANLLERYVEEGESWSKARSGYLLTLSEQMKSISMMSNWLGGTYVKRHRKGDPNADQPITPVPAEKQREALQFVIDKSFYDDSFGLTPEVLNHMTVDKWWDRGGMSSIFEDPSWPVHDRILGIQAAALTQLMNPTTLGRVYDNEFRVPADEDYLTLPELMSTISNSIWTELEGGVNQRYTARKPMISSLRRNLQHEHMERLIDLTMPESFSGAAAMPVSNLAIANLRSINQKIESILDGNSGRIDPYTLAHLQEVSERITSALDAEYIYNTDDLGGSMPSIIFFGDEPQQK